MVNATSNGNSSVGQGSSQQTGVVGTMQTHTITGQPLTTATASATGTASRVLLPHELGSLAVQSQPLHQTFQFHQQLQTQSVQLQQTSQPSPLQQQQQHQQQQQQYIFYNNSNLSNLTTTFVTQNNIPKPSSLGAIQYNNVDASNGLAAAATTTTTTTNTSTGPILMTTNKSSQPKLNQIIATNTFASSPNSSINNRTAATTSTTNASIVAVKAGEIKSQSDGGIQRNGIASITDNNNSNYSPTSNSVSNSNTTIQTNDIKHTTSTNQLIGHGSTVGSTTSKVSPPPSSLDQQPTQTPPPPPTSSTTDHSIVDDTNEQENEPEPEIDIVINNVVCSFSVRCHLNLREIALNGRNVEFRRENGMVTMKLRRPYTTASIWSSGRITCTGATSEDQVSQFESNDEFHFFFLDFRI